MITIDLGTIEYYDGKLNKFAYFEGGVVRFEYSLKVIYDWEGKWLKPFLKSDLTDEELIDFYMTMALDPIEEKFISHEVMETLSEYVGKPHTATIFTTPKTGQNGNKVDSKGKFETAEELYALMFEHNIPIEFENRNLNRLMTIMKITTSRNSTPKKMSKADIYSQNAQINAARKQKMNTKG